MKMKFLFRAFLVCGTGIAMVMAAGPVLAQRASVDVFDRTLETLRESVARLLKENAQINTANLAARARIKILKEDLRSLEAEARRLEEKEVAERQRVQARSGGVEALKLQVAQADEALKRAREEVSAEQAKFTALENEEKDLRQKADALSENVSLMNRSGMNTGRTGNGFDALKKEQEQLQSKLAGVTDRVQEAKRHWQDVNAVVTKGPQQLDVLKAEHDKLARAAAKAEADLAKISAQLADVQSGLERMRAEDYGDTRAGRLDSEVKEMTERNRKLESEILTIVQTKEEALKRLQADQERSGSQYQARYEELLQRNVDLKFELNSLRKQMVDMDKKKAELEAVIYPEH